VTEHFSDKELACKCCGKQNMKIGFMSQLEALRLAYDKPIILTSAFRCSKRNQAVSNTGRHGPHTTGCAVDIAVHGIFAYELLSIAIRFGFTGIGIKQHGNGRFIHLDTLLVDFPRPRIWTY
jgi:uncharacterized protein YcbK (DUF882 family)